MEEPDLNPLTVSLSVLELSEAQADAGDTVPLEVFLDELRQSIARMEARQPGQDTAAD